VTTEEALVKLGDSTGEAVQGVLSSLCSEETVERGPASVVPAGSLPLQSIPVPAVATAVSYVDGVTGGNVFVITRLGARRLAASMMFQEPPDDAESELDELELSAVGEAMNQMMAAAAGATSKVLGQEVEISVPETRLLEAAGDADGVYPSTPHATTVSFSLHGEPCRLIQLVPNAFVVRMTRALADLAAEENDNVPAPAGDSALSAVAIREVPVRLSAELGRARLPLGRAVGLNPGAVVELDRSAEDAIDLYVNGLRFATGRLLLIDQTEWAVRVERLLDVDARHVVRQGGG
jgi:flagellar motor switch protein FliN